MEAPCALLCTSNGVGLGHLTRAMAVADELGDDVRTVIFTLSAAVAVPVRLGFHVEHLRSVEQGGMPTQRWHNLLADRVDHLVQAYRPSVVMFDGVHPYRGFVHGLGVHRRHVHRVWERRAMWKPGIGVEAMTMARHFDSVVEPGEYAESYDAGATVAVRDRAARVAPVVYHRPGPDTRAAACAELGLDPAATNVLVQLGAGQINDVQSLTGAVVAALRRAGGLHVCVARSELSNADADTPSDVTTISRFPISSWYAAFDATVLASGYNSFHEALAAGVPTLFVPNLVTRTDDQDARSRWAADEGMALRWDGTDPDALDAAVAALADPERRAAMRDRLATLPPAGGAAEVADLIRGWTR